MAGAAAGCPTRVAGKGTAEAPPVNAVRIASGGLIYSGLLRQADFTGGIRAETLDGTVVAGEATVYREPQAVKGTSTGQEVVNRESPAVVPPLAGDLDRVVASGHVRLDKPGIRATGERLVYTASDRVFLLTGSSTNPPRAVDAQGTTTGAALRFQSVCGSVDGGRVEALGSVPGEAGQTVHTDVRITNEGKKEKGKQ
jgi:lipopolysaccharide export system protein LptA